MLARAVLLAKLFAD